MTSEPGRPPLDGLVVLDLSRVLAGPLAAQSLGDMGATVIKVENPDGGDDTRGWGPPYHDELAAYFLAFNRNKRSVAINLKSPAGAGIVRDLAAQADILIENYRLGTLDRMGLGYERLAEINPGLIYASVSGYGRDGPRASEPGYDFVIQAESGLMSITGPTDGPPMKLGLPISDIVTGLTLTQSILAALHARVRDGLGQHIDIALLEAQMAVMGNVGTGVLVTGKDAGRFGNAHPNIVPYQVFETSDGPIVIACGNERQYAALCKGVLDRPDLAEDARFATNSQRVRNRAAFEEIVGAILAARPRDHWMERLTRSGIPAGRTRSVREALQSPEALARGVVQPVREGGGTLNLLRAPHRFSRTPIDERPTAPPALGADTDRVLGRMLGLGAAEISALRKAGVIGGGD